MMAMKILLDATRTFSLYGHQVCQSMNIRALTRMTKASWWGNQWSPDLTSL